MNNATVANATSVVERIFHIVAEHAEQPREVLDRDTSLGEYLDSLGITELIMDLEDEFELSIPDEEAQHIKTVGQTIDAVESRLRTRAEAAPADANPPASP